MAGFISRLIVFLVNFIFLLCGIAVLVFGIVTLSSPTTIIDALSFIPGYENLDYIVDVQQAVLNGGIMMTVIGSVLVVLCLFGLVASCSSGKCLLGIYISLTLLVLYFELAVIIYFSIESQSVENRIQDLMFTSLVQNFQPVTINGTNILNGSTAGAMAWEGLQFTYACCGAHGYLDYNSTGFDWQKKFDYNPNAIVPPSCCQQIVQYEVPTLTNQITNLTGCLSSAPEYTNVKGCYTALTEVFFVYGYVKMITLAGLVAVEVLVLMISCRLLCINQKQAEIDVVY